MFHPFKRSADTYAHRRDERWNVVEEAIDEGASYDQLEPVFIAARADAVSAGLAAGGEMPAGEAFLRDYARALLASRGC